MNYSFSGTPPEGFGFDVSYETVAGKMKKYRVKQGSLGDELMGWVEVDGIPFHFRSVITPRGTIYEPAFSGDIFAQSYKGVLLSGSMKEVQNRLSDAGMPVAQREWDTLVDQSSNCSIFFYEGEAASIAWHPS
ncbi:MAG TPA: hypothetical protein H9870_10890 [Candidatus Corynebacterium avicola]|uniref:Uncharacterized protein n=1 Tax=Candidatus Corynebacterium avicola TaxID=2838527 RepID=A0A9D1RRW5_9CORY|nr:hypothetical protein [Candidatus Corynebacterium avicola]